MAPGNARSVRGERVMVGKGMLDGGDALRAQLREEALRMADARDRMDAAPRHARDRRRARGVAHVAPWLRLVRHERRAAVRRRARAAHRRDDEPHDRVDLVQARIAARATVPRAAAGRCRGRAPRRSPRSRRCARAVVLQPVVAQTRRRTSGCAASSRAPPRRGRGRSTPDSRLRRGAAARRRRRRDRRPAHRSRRRALPP